MGWENIKWFLSDSVVFVATYFTFNFFLLASAIIQYELIQTYQEIFYSNYRFKNSLILKEWFQNQISSTSFNLRWPKNIRICLKSPFRSVSLTALKRYWTSCNITKNFRTKTHHKKEKIIRTSQILASLYWTFVLCTLGSLFNFRCLLLVSFCCCCCCFYLHV